MAHTYVITSVTTLGDLLTITGSVDGSPVTVTAWVSGLPAGAMASAIAFRNVASSLMLAAIPQPTALPTLVQTFTQ